MYRKYFDQIILKMNAKKVGNNYLTCCPAHNDKNPSLSISVTAKGKILWHCFAGCSQLDIFNALTKSGVLKGRGVI